MDKNLINGAIAGGLSIAYSVFGEGLSLMDITTLKTAGLIAGSMFVNDMWIKPFLLKGFQLGHTPALKSMEEMVIDGMGSGLCYLLSAKYLGVSKGSAVKNMLRGGAPAVLAPVVHGMMENMMPKV
jgi:hypothetical protein